jgi:hypothetical protein
VHSGTDTAQLGQKNNRSNYMARENNPGPVDKQPLRGSIEIKPQQGTIFLNVDRILII